MKTIDYYNDNADSFCEDTINANMTSLYELFEKHLSPGGHILDCGCGSGRDSKYFLDKGYEVTAIDASEELCKRAAALIGREVACMTFMEISYENMFDGVWACSSLLHEKKENLNTVLKKIVKATKVNGIIYVSFKYGNYSGDRNGRFFTDLTEAGLHELISDVNVEVIDMRVTGDVRPGRENEKWLNAVLRKI